MYKEGAKAPVASVWAFIWSNKYLANAVLQGQLIYNNAEYGGGAGSGNDLYGEVILMDMMIY